MYKLCILLPTINEDRCLNVIQQLSSFLSPDIKLFVYNQCFELPTFDNVINLYSEVGMGTMLSSHYCIKNAPESQYYYFIDDDFEFNSGFGDSIIKTIDYMEQNKICVCSIVHKKNKFFCEPNIDQRPAKIYEIPLLRKESGILIKNGVYIGSHLDVAYGEDNAILTHAYLDGYDVGISFVTNIIHHNNQMVEESWNRRSEIMYGQNYKKLQYEFYGRKYFMAKGYISQGQNLTKLAIDIHNYNYSRLNYDSCNSNK